MWDCICVLFCFLIRWWVNDLELPRNRLVVKSIFKNKIYFYFIYKITLGNNQILPVLVSQPSAGEVLFILFCFFVLKVPIMSPLPHPCSHNSYPYPDFRRNRLIHILDPSILKLMHVMALSASLGETWPTILFSNWLYGLLCYPTSHGRAFREWVYFIFG